MRRPSIPSANACSRLLVLSILSIVSLFFAPSLPAQGWVEIERPVDRPGPPGSVSRTSSNVRIAIDGRVAGTEIEERFRNDGVAIAEGSYLYPMPGEAVFTNFSLWMGDQEVRGETMNADQARSIYEEIVRRRKDPALLTFAGHGLLRARVFPIQPGETRKVALRYTQLLTRAGDALRLRYSLGTRGSGASSLVVTTSKASSYGTPYSPTHAIESRRIGDRLEITFSGDAAGEVELFLPLRRGLVGTSLVAHAPGGEDGYFMLLLAPAESQAAVTVPRDITLVVDVSGSMSGTKLEQAKAALEQAIGTLGEADRFRLIAFSSAVRRFRTEFVPANRENLSQARQFLAALGAEGGTNIAGALDAALENPPGDGERLGIILFLTDGIPSVGEQGPDRIAEQAASRIGRTRIFTVGIGHDVNTYLLDRLALRGRGSAEYVPPGTSVETAMSSLMGKLRYPALVDLRIGDSPVTLAQVFPTQLPDLFYGEELVVFGRYRGTGRGNVIVTGRRNGREEQIRAAAVFPSSEADNEFIPRLWAARQIGELTRQIRLEGASAGLISQVRELALRFGILTEYTSYLVLEPPEAGVARGRSAPPRLEDGGGASNSAAQTGQRAFERARASSKFSEAKSLAEADSAAAGQLSSLAPAAAEAPPTRRAGGRIFLMRGQVWTDIGHTDRITITEVEAYSRAYFDLVRQLPEIASYLAVGDQVLIAGGRASIRVAYTGVQAWKPGQLADLVRNFRGT